LIGRAKSSTSDTRWFSRVTSSSISATAVWIFDDGAASCFSDRSAVLMIINGLRISCATTVERRPSDDSRSRCAASRWNRAIDSVIVLNVLARRRASSSSHRPCGESTIFLVKSPVAAIWRIVAVIVPSGRVTVRATA
jgi:hypothetical protein